MRSVREIVIHLKPSGSVRPLLHLLPKGFDSPKTLCDAGLRGSRLASGRLRASGGRVMFSFLNSLLFENIGIHVRHSSIFCWSKTLHFEVRCFPPPSYLEDSGDPITSRQLTAYIVSFSFLSYGASSGGLVRGPREWTGWVSRSRTEDRVGEGAHI